MLVLAGVFFMKRFFLDKFQSLQDSASNANRYVQGKYQALKAVVLGIKHFIKEKYQAIIAIPSKIKTSIQNKYHAFKESVSRKKNYVVHQYKRFRDSRFVKTIKFIFKFLYSYALPISASFILTELMSRIRMPAYMMVLQNIGDPRSAYFVLGSSILIPTLIGTKTYRVIKGFYQKYVMKTQAAELVPAHKKIIQKAEVAEIKFKEIAHPDQFTKPEFTTVRSNLKHKKRSAPRMPTDLEEEQNEHDSDIDIDVLEKSLKQSWSFQDKEPKAQASALILPEVKKIVPLRSHVKRKEISENDVPKAQPQGLESVAICSSRRVKRTLSELTVSMTDAPAAHSNKKRRSSCRNSS